MRPSASFHPMFLGSRVIFWLALTSVCAISGCGSAEKPMLQVFPVAGEIHVDGVVPVRAEIRLRPKTPINDPMKRSVEPHATVQEDGTFIVGTYSDDDGAPPGEYALTITWPVITVEGGEDVVGADRLKGRFSDPSQPIATIHVEDSDNQIPPIELKSK